MTRTRFLVFLLLSLSISLGCSDSPTEPPSRASIADGVVHVVQMQTGVPGVTVLIQDQSTLTDDNGRFTFSDLATGPTVISLRKEGWVPADFPVALHAGANGLISLPLEPEP